MASAASPEWIARLRQRADAAPSRPREALFSGESQIGSIEVTLGVSLVDAGLPLRAAGMGWRLRGSPSPALEVIARWLNANGLGGRWRDELLSVIDAAGTVVGQIERAAVRPLGIATQAVHLVGYTADAKVWAQQRALDKATDPGAWDTLMGGLVAAGETLEDTLARETWEEAGLVVGSLQDLRRAGSLVIRRPVSDGYMVERIAVFEAWVPSGVTPVNQDGEVERFECLDAARLMQRLQEESFTLEAALILLDWLGAGSLSRISGKGQE